jgi:hypothetical protein
MDLIGDCAEHRRDRLELVILEIYRTTAATTRDPLLEILMSKGISIHDVIRAALNGVKIAFKSFARLTQHEKWWLDEAPEYFVTVNVADAIAKRTGDSVWFEYKVGETQLEGGGELRGRPHRDENLNGRHDIVVFRRSSDAPWCVIEVKSPVYSMNDLIRKDIKRLVQAISRRTKNGSIAYGVLVFYSSRHANAKDDLIEDMADKLKTFAEESLGERGIDATVSLSLQALIKGSKYGTASAGCLCIKAHRRHSKIDLRMPIQRASAEG